MLRRCALASLAVSLLAARPALAELASRDDTYEAGYDPGKQKRRSDFTAGIAFAPIGFGSASGYPNEVAKIGDPRYEATTGLTGSNATSVWIGVAFRDWMVFGLGIHPYNVLGKDCNPFKFDDTSADCVRSQGGVFMLHVEAYPFFYQAPALENLGLFTEIGAGNRTIMKGTATIADGGIMSFASLGIVYEPIRLWDHFSMGPYIQGGHEFSDTLTANSLVLGFRAVYYGGP